MEGVVEVAVGGTGVGAGIKSQEASRSNQQRQVIGRYTRCTILAGKGSGFRKVALIGGVLCICTLYIIPTSKARRFGVNPIGKCLEST